MDQPGSADTGLRAHQSVRFDAMMRRVLRANVFQQAKFERVADARRPPSLDGLRQLPLTTKAELVADQAAHPPFGSNLTYPLQVFTRIHQTSGTTGSPLSWLDTDESWEWWLDCWEEVYRAAGVTPSDRVFVAFSFGPFIGFWTAFDAAHRLGALAIPGGGLDSIQRLEAIATYGATVLVCTPTYALRLADVARGQGLDLAAGSVRVTIHAGEPGASVPNVKRRIETEWGASCVDHVGATEVGAWGFGCGESDHVHVNEAEFIVEVLDPETGRTAAAGEGGSAAGELVLTNLGRVGSPLIRYRTGDLVELVRTPCACGRRTAYLEGGVRGRIDDMIVVRGVNVYPSAVENLVREFPAIREFEVLVETRREMADLRIRVEVDGGVGEGFQEEVLECFHRHLHLRPRIDVVPANTLPRYELKSRRFRWTDRR